MNKNNIIKSGLLLTALASPLAFSANFESPDSVENTIEKESSSKPHWREELSNKGITFGADYLALGLSSPNGSQGNSVNRSSGIARFYGSWHIVGKGTEDTGGVVWKVEHRHAYSSTPPKNMAFIDDISNGPEGLGYVGMIAPAYNDQEQELLIYTGNKNSIMEKHRCLLGGKM